MKVVDEITDFNPNTTYMECPKKGMKWMLKNLDIDDVEGGIIRNPDHPEYGCYYTWDAAKRIADKIPGWHLPTPQEWDMLAVIAGGSDIVGKKLKSRTGWKDDGNGTDDFGFSALPAGCYEGDFHYVGSNTYFWTASDNDSNCALNRHFDTWSTMHLFIFSKNCQFSVRLVKDYE